MSQITDTIEALQKILELNPETKSVVPEHDEIYVGHEIELENVSEEDIKYLEDRVFEWDDDIECFRRMY